MSDFSKIRSGESEGIRFGQLFAKIYYYMGKNILEAMGEEEGSRIIAKAVREFGEDRVAGMKEEAAERGIEVTDEESFFSIRDMPNCGWQSGERRGICTRCLFDEVLKSYGETGRKMMKLYCPIDYIIYGSFGFELDRPQCKGDGDDICVFNLSRKQ